MQTIIGDNASKKEQKFMLNVWGILKMTLDGFAKKHNTIKDNLRWLCRQHPSVMEDYRKLVQYYWYYVNGLKVFVPMEQLNKLTNPESIGRAFRKLIEEGELVVPNPVLDARTDEERKYRDYYRKDK